MSPVVLLHGWGAVPAVWQALIDALPEQLIINLSLPGYDNSGDWHSPEAYIVSQLPPRCHLVGWSLGGNLAMAVAATDPQRLASVTTIATVPSFVANEQWPYGMENRVFTAFMNSIKTDPTATLRRFIALQAQGAPNGREITNAMRQWLTSASHQTLIDSLNWLGACQQSELWFTLDLPRLHLFCEGDALVPVAAAAHCPHSRVLPAAGHAPMVSKPRELASMLDQFWQQVTNP